MDDLEPSGGKHEPATGSQAEQAASHRERGEDPAREEPKREEPKPDTRSPQQREKDENQRHKEKQLEDDIERQVLDAMVAHAQDCPLLDQSPARYWTKVQLIGLIHDARNDVGTCATWTPRCPARARR